MNEVNLFHQSLKSFVMSLRLGDVAPNFKAQTTAGEIDFYEYLGS